MRDLREYARKTNIRLVAGTILLVFVVGLGLIYAFYGPGGALTGLVCILGTIVPIGLIAGLLWVMDKAVERYNRD